MSGWRSSALPSRNLKNLRLKTLPIGYQNWIQLCLTNPIKHRHRTNRQIGYPVSAMQNHQLPKKSSVGCRTTLKQHPPKSLTGSLNFSQQRRVLPTAAMNSSPSEPTLSIGQQPKQSLKNPSHRTCRIGWQTSNPPTPTRLLPRQPLSANHPVRKANLNGCPKTVSRHKNPLRRKRRSSRGWMKMQTRQKPNLPAQR